MRKEDFYFESADKKTQIHAVKWAPDSGGYRAVLQITHGMQEYIGRYQEFAEFLTKKGVLVVGHDHLGHGESVADAGAYGFFSESRPSDMLIRDMHTLRRTVQGQNRGKPYFMLGHSMGSYMLRKYITKYSKGLAGAVIVGTGSMPDGLMILGMGICRFLAGRYGWNYRSRLVKSLSFLGPYRRYDVTGRDIRRNWLTRDLEIAKRFYQDPKCTFDFTVNGYFGLMQAVYYDNQPKYIEEIRKSLPLFLVSGDADPVGDMGRGVKKVYRQYKKAGISDVSMKLYQGGRHEVLNETDRDLVYEDIYGWLQERIK